MRPSVKGGTRRLVRAVAPTALGRYRRARRRLRLAAYGSQFGAVLADRLGVRRRTFEQVYRSATWTKRQRETRSGLGSTLEATEGLRAALPAALAELRVRTLLDVPCGDWNWMSKVDLPVARYIGGDVVPALIARDRERFGDDHHEFRVIDICVDPLPSADMLLCRDALIHFSYVDIWRALSNIARADIMFVAMTTFDATTTNEDIPTGAAWRALNLRAAPFGLPAPSSSLPDAFDRPDKRVAVWSNEDIRRAAATRRTS